MSQLVNALKQGINELGRTANDAETLLSSMNNLVDFFFLAGSSRGKDITSTFANAYKDDPELTGRIALWMRDVRGGAGEREQFRNFLRWSVKTDVEFTNRILARGAEVGRWDDVLALIDTESHNTVVELIDVALRDGNGLCAKWMPRKGETAAKLRKALGMTPKQYRKTLVSLSDTVEQKMCSGNWDQIEFKKVPSRAFSIYSDAFTRHQQARFNEFLEKVASGEEKIHAGAIFPHDIILKVLGNGGKAAELQWDCLPDYTEGSNERMIVVADVSGSMGGLVGGPRGPQPMLVSISLALYASKFLKGPFKDTFITFSSEPRLQQVTGTITNRINQLHRAEWGMSTDLQKVFEVLLNSAVQHSVLENEMPTKIVIISDMEFNACVHGRNYDAITKKYEAAGYKLPQIVFWNVNVRAGNVPVKYDQEGTALISGYSPSIMKSLVNGEIKTPIQVMLDTVMNERYTF